MMKNKTYSLLIFSGLLSFFLLQSTFAQQQPNIIVITADDMGYNDLESYGGAYATPNIDRIGQQGIRFTDFYVAAPVCTPSRYAFLTGSYPMRSMHGLKSALMPNDRNYLDTSETTIASYLKTVGYRTALIGKWHLGQKGDLMPWDYGFDYYAGFMGGCIDYFHHSYGALHPDWYANNQTATESGYSTDLITEHAERFIESATSQQQPFFIDLAYNAPHYGKSDPDNLPDYTLSVTEGTYDGLKMINSLQVPKKYLDRFSDIEDIQKRVYAAMVTALDDNIGRLLDYLKENDLLENTLIFFYSDNGAYGPKSSYPYASNHPLRGGKASLWEGGIRVPAMVMWQGKIKAGQIVNTPVCNVDFVPTLAGITGYSTQDRTAFLDGEDIRDVLFEAAEKPRTLYWTYWKQTALRHGKWKLVNGKYLFNLQEDISESNDLAAQQPEVLHRLQALEKQQAIRIENPGHAER